VVAAFRDLPLADTSYPHVFLDATYCKARVGRRVVSHAVGVGVAADGRKEALGSLGCSGLIVGIW
jgi:transposase-like protein